MLLAVLVADSASWWLAFFPSVLFLDINVPPVYLMYVTRRKFNNTWKCVLTHIMCWLSIYSFNRIKINMYIHLCDH